MQRRSEPDTVLVRAWRIVAGDPRTISRTRSEFSAALHGAERSGEEVEIGTIILGELLANACEHGVPPVAVELRRSRGRFTLVVTDAGHGFTRPAFRDPLSLRGRGLSIIEALGGVIRLSSRPFSRVEVALPFGA